MIKSNQNAQLLIDIQSRYSPEGASSNGVRGLDEQIVVPGPETRERLRADMPRREERAGIPAGFRSKTRWSSRTWRF